MSEKSEFSVMEAGKFPLKSYLINYKSTLGPNTLYISYFLVLFPPQWCFFATNSELLRLFIFSPIQQQCFSHFPISLPSSSPFYTGSNYFNCGNSRENERETFLSFDTHTFASLLTLNTRLLWKSVILAGKVSENFLRFWQMKLRENRFYTFHFQTYIPPDEMFCYSNYVDWSPSQNKHWTTFFV